MSAPVLIQGAMAVETDWLVSQLEGREEIVLGGYRFWSGVYCGRELVVSRTEIGELNAACATTLGILHFKPEAVITQGIAGSHSEELHICDVVLGETCININDWATTVRGRGEGSDLSQWYHGEGQLVLDGDATLLRRFAAAPYRDGKLLCGRLGSGDLFSREYDRILWLREQCGHLCEDMESIAAYQACCQLGVPCLGVRMISNNELTGEVYTPSVGERLQKLVLGAICDKK